MLGECYISFLPRKLPKEPYTFPFEVLILLFFQDYPKVIKCLCILKMGPKGLKLSQISSISLEIHKCNSKYLTPVPKVIEMTQGRWIKGMKLFQYQIGYKNISGRILFYFIHFMEISFSLRIISINSLDYVKS